MGSFAGREIQLHTDACWDAMIAAAQDKLGYVNKYNNHHSEIFAGLAIATNDNDEDLDVTER